MWIRIHRPCRWWCDLSASVVDSRQRRSYRLRVMMVHRVIGGSMMELLLLDPVVVWYQSAGRVQQQVTVDKLLLLLLKELVMRVMIGCLR